MVAAFKHAKNGLYNAFHNQIGQENMQDTYKKTVLITGALGFVGKRLVRLLAETHPETRVVATGRKPPEQADFGIRSDNLVYRQLDVRDRDIAAQLKSEQVDTVVHLASVVTPGPGMDRQTMHDIDVGGTRNMLEASLAAGVGKFIITTSAASYGYHPDNPVPLRETDAVRGNVEFPYSDHKRLIEEMLADYRQQHPELLQLVFRPGFILGFDCDNQITALFEKPAMIGIGGTLGPFTIIWDEDVAQCIIEGILDERSGIYNLTGDGIVTMKDMAGMLGKPFISLPAGLLKSALWLLKRLGVSQYGPEQINFLRYRPVLSNEALKRDFAYRLQRSSLECFLDYARHRGLLKNEPVPR